MGAFLRYLELLRALVPNGFGANGLYTVDEDTNHFRLTREFLQNPQAYLRRLIG